MELIWTEGQHIRPTRREELGQLLDVVLSRIDKPPMTARRRWTLILLVAVAIIAVSTAIVINVYRDSVALKVANSFLADSDAAVTDVSVESIGTDAVRFGEIVIGLPGRRHSPGQGRDASGAFPRLSVACTCTSSRCNCCPQPRRRKARPTWPRACGRFSKPALRCMAPASRSTQ